METKDCGRWALYGSSEVAGVSATGGPVAGVLVAGGSVLALSKVMEVSWDRFPSCGSCSRALTSMCTWLLSLVPRPFSYAHAREGKEGSGK